MYSADGALLATGHGSADAGERRVVWSGREFEKAETAAIGRALAHAGFGTQFTADDEGEHLADSPVERSAQPATKRAPAKPHADPLVAEGMALAGGAPWLTRDGNPDRLLAWAAKERGLSSTEVCEALGVKSVVHYAGSKADAVAAIDAYIADRAAIPAAGGGA